MSAYGHPNNDHDPDRSKSTHSIRRRFSQRTTGLPWNLTFAQAAEKVGDDASGCSHMPSGDRDKFAGERLHPMITN